MKKINVNKYTVIITLSLILALAALALLLLNIVTYYQDPWRNPETPLAHVLHEPNATEITQTAAQLHQERAQALREKNLFTDPPPPPSMPQAHGILGNEAFMNGSWHKKGDNVAGAEILAITSTYVLIKWQGQEKKLYPFGVASEPTSPSAYKPKARSRFRRIRPAQNDDEQQAHPDPADDDPLAWMGVELSPALRAKILEQWNSIPDEYKDQFKQRWEQMSTSERDNMIEMMEKNIDRI